jgi:hypothetical protein
MDCGCPDPDPVPSGCNYIACSGGPIQTVYRLVEQAIPADADLVHGRPQVHEDGSLEFAHKPPMLSGYQRKGLRLVPVWPPCRLRMLKVECVDKALTIEGICGNPEGEHLGRLVTLDQCRKCSKRQAASV